MSDDHSKLVPLLPIPNRTVKRLRADDSVHPHVKVGHRQTPYKANAPPEMVGRFAFLGGIDLIEIRPTRRIAACCGEGSHSLPNVESQRDARSQSRSSSDSLQTENTS